MSYFGQMIELRGRAPWWVLIVLALLIWLASRMIAPGDITFTDRMRIISSGNPSYYEIDGYVVPPSGDVPIPSPNLLWAYWPMTNHTEYREGLLDVSGNGRDLSSAYDNRVWADGAAPDGSAAIATTLSSGYKIDMPLLNNVSTSLTLIGWYWLPTGQNDWKLFGRTSSQTPSLLWQTAAVNTIRDYYVDYDASVSFTIPGGFGVFNKWVKFCHKWTVGGQGHLCVDGVWDDSGAGTVEGTGWASPGGVSGLNAIGGDNNSTYGTHAGAFFRQIAVYTNELSFEDCTNYWLATAPSDYYSTTNDWFRYYKFDTEYIVMSYGPSPGRSNGYWYDSTYVVWQTNGTCFFDRQGTYAVPIVPTGWTGVTPASQPYTFACWIKPTITPPDSNLGFLLGAVDTAVNSTYIYFAIQYTAPDLRVRNYYRDTDGNLADSGYGGSIPLNEWTHVAATWDGTYSQVWTGGVMVASSVATNMTGNIDLQSSYLDSPYLGGYNNNRPSPMRYPYEGYMDDFIIDLGTAWSSNKLQTIVGYGPGGIPD